MTGDIRSEFEGKFAISSFEPVSAGLSDEEKFRIETQSGEKLLLRVADISEYERKKAAYDIMTSAAAAGVPMNLPVDFGVCCGGERVYRLMSWCEGENVEKLLPSLSEAEQFSVGKRAGEILRKMHSVPAPSELGEWSERYFGLNDARIESFKGCGVAADGADALLRYVEDNRNLLVGRPQCLRHGDYHVGNLVVTDAGEVSVIDWELIDFDNYADPYSEFASIGLSEVHPYFATGLLRGYFNGEPPQDFWKLLAFYLSAGALMLVSWAYYLQPDELEYAMRHVGEVVRWYDGFRTLIPNWHIQN